ncbi:MAG: hypothetical protein E6I90_10140 [Chloroflexi bacterium]|nr:MAG: hypothetical protein E6I90_10140 [Chloroflexota bacterium]
MIHLLDEHLQIRFRVGKELVLFEIHLLLKQATVHGILTNPTYTGVVYIGRTRCHTARTR